MEFELDEQQSAIRAIATVRWRLYQTAAKMVSHGYQVLLKIAASLVKVATIIAQSNVYGGAIYD